MCKYFTDLCSMTLGLGTSFQNCARSWEPAFSISAAIIKNLSCGEACEPARDRKWSTYSLIQRNFHTAFLKYWADVGKVTGHVVPPCKDTTMSTEAPGSQQLLLGLTLYFSGAVVLTCRGCKRILRPLNNCPPLSHISTVKSMFRFT